MRPFWLSDTEPNRVLALSFWNTKEDAERYHREQYPAIHEMVRISPRRRTRDSDLQCRLLNHAQNRSQQSRLNHAQARTPSHPAERSCLTPDD